MEKKMSVMGVGAKIGLPTFLTVAVAETVSWFARPVFGITNNYQTLLIIGLSLIAVGFTLNLAAAFPMLKASMGGKLQTRGLYAIFRDPMYVVMIFLTLPGVFLLLNSWLVLLCVVPAYLFYRHFVREEHKYLENKFGEEYREYLKKIAIKI